VAEVVPPPLLLVPLGPLEVGLRGAGQDRRVEVLDLSPVGVSPRHHRHGDPEVRKLVACFPENLIPHHIGSKPEAVHRMRLKIGYTAVRIVIKKSHTQNNTLEDWYRQVLSVLEELGHYHVALGFEPQSVLPKCPSLFRIKDIPVA